MPFLASASTRDAEIHHNDENRHQAQERFLFKRKTYVLPVAVVVVFFHINGCLCYRLHGRHTSTVKRDNAIKTDIFCCYIYCRKKFS